LVPETEREKGPDFNRLAGPPTAIIHQIPFFIIFSFLAGLQHSLIVGPIMLGPIENQLRYVLPVLNIGPIQVATDCLEVIKGLQGKYLGVNFFRNGDRAPASASIDAYRFLY
jgi:hypothetical protein